MYPESLLTRFRSVDALAQQGAPGERDNARRIVERMEREHPNIRLFAYPPEPPPEPREWYESSRARSAPDPWERVRSAASGAWSWAAKVAQEVTAANEARNMADEICELNIKFLPSGKWQMALRMDHQDLSAAAANLTPFQKAEFVQHILAAIEAELHEALR